MNPLDPLKPLLDEEEYAKDSERNEVFEILKDAKLGHHYNAAEEAALLGISSKNMFDLEDLNSVKSSKIPSRGRRLLRRVVRFLVEDWMFLALLGMSTAVCSLAMEYAIEHLQEWHIDTYRWASELESEADHFYFTYLIWMLYAVVLVTSSALFAHYVAPQAIGSGIPEMKTILRGVILKEYLTVRTLCSKMVGLTLSLGSGLPLGKEGPFVHVASVVAQQLSRFVGGIHGAYANESRSTEMLAAGCAVGVACTFSAPIGGVLFSIEVTSVYFAVRNYWRGFFAALCAATTFRICRLWLSPSEVTVIAYYQTRFPKESFFPEELPVFAMVGLVSGLAGAVFIKSHRGLVLFLRRSNLAKRIIQKNWVIYPMLVAFLVSSLTYPKGFGQFLSGEHKFSQTLKMFLSNCTWTALPHHHNACPAGFLDEWTKDGQNSVFQALPLFTLTFFVLSIVASTLPIPAGIFMPVFVIGASFGRLVGEYMAEMYPDGIRTSDPLEIYPGVYAVVGAAAFCGAVTHTVSVAVIVFELTGQLMHILPVMIAVVIANAVCSYLQPSIYDSIIQMKHLPYLPDLSHASSVFHNIQVDQIMISDVKYIWKKMKLHELRELLENSPRIKAFPIVVDKRSMVLLGSASRAALQEKIDNKIGIQARQTEATRRIREAYSRQQSRARLSLSGQDINSSGTEKATQNRRFSVVQLPRTLVKEIPRLPRRQAARSTRRHSDCERLALTTEGRQFSGGPLHHTIQSHDSSLAEMFRRSLTRLSFGRITRKDTSSNDFDLHDEERRLWENSRLLSELDFETLTIDPAPFQLVEHTSLFKVHSLFSLLGLSRAYVTQFGRLIGVVSLRELRIGIERTQDGQLFPGGPPMHVEKRSDAEQEYLDSNQDRLQPRLEVVRPPRTSVTSMTADAARTVESPLLKRLLSKETDRKNSNKKDTEVPAITVTDTDEPTDEQRQRMCSE